MACRGSLMFIVFQRKSTQWRSYWIIFGFQPLMVPCLSCLNHHVYQPGGCVRGIPRSSVRLNSRRDGWGSVQSYGNPLVAGWITLLLDFFWWLKNHLSVLFGAESFIVCWLIHINSLSFLVGSQCLKIMLHPSISEAIASAKDVRTKTAPASARAGEAVSGSAVRSLFCVGLTFFIVRCLCLSFKGINLVHCWICSWKRSGARV